MSRRPIFPYQTLLCSLAAVCLTAAPLMAALPMVSSVTALQRPGTKLVDVAYTLADPDSPTVTVSLEISSDGGTNWFVPGTDLSGDSGPVAPGNRSLTWNAGVTWDNKYTPGMKFRVVADERVAPAGYQLIPQSTVEIGEFQPEGPYTGASNLRPLHSASIRPFFIAHHELSFAKWQAAYNWSLSRGYSYFKPGTGKASTHPVNEISWYDALKWCNAASEMEGLEPCYTVLRGGLPQREFHSGLRLDQKRIPAAYFG